MISTIISTDPRVWIGCLACYNAGRLTGEWVDAVEAGDTTPEDIHGHATTHEELWVMDHENFDGMLKGECSPAEAQRLAEVLIEVPEHTRAAFAYFVGEGNEPSDFEEAFRGEWDSERDYAQDYAADTLGELPSEWPLSYIDWDAAASDLFTGDLWSAPAPGHGVWVFQNCN